MRLGIKDLLPSCSGPKDEASCVQPAPSKDLRRDSHAMGARELPPRAFLIALRQLQILLQIHPPALLVSPDSVTLGLPGAIPTAS